MATKTSARMGRWPDMDSHNASTPPPVGSSFGVTQGADDSSPDETSVEDEPLTPEDILLYVAIGTGSSAVLLFGVLMFRSSSATPEKVLQEE